MNDRSTRFSELYEREFPAVHQFLIRRSDDAEDIAHETFTTAWRRLDEVPTEPAAERAWLFATARNLLMNHRRAAARADAYQVRIANQFETTIAGPEAAGVAAVDIANAWRQLTPAQQEVISLFAWEELTIGQTAQVLGVSVPTVRLRLSRARNAFRKFLAH